ncbi:MAG: cell surface protein SprA [Prevotellaceae bacterium]|nr:cell surface protein SprA [Prevotellaceae bacterium]
MAIDAVAFSGSMGMPSETGEQAPKDTASTQRRKSRYAVKKTTAQQQEDLEPKTADLRDPRNMQTEVDYDERDDSYTVGTTLLDDAGADAKAKQTTANAPKTPVDTSEDKDATNVTSSGTASHLGYAVSTLPRVDLTERYLDVPLRMTSEEYQRWTMRQSMSRYFRDRNAETFESKGKEKFDFTDMHFDLGPADKIFGPGGVRIKTQGSAELKVGMTMKKVDNPSLAVNRRKTNSFDFDEKINLSLTGSVGDKINMKMNYNTDASFDFDSQSMKLKYDGKEDEIIKLIEAGNVSMPSNNSLIPGVASLFGLRTDLQFGRLTMQTVVSQKKSATKSVSSKGGTSTNTYEFSASNYEENRHFFLSHFFRQQYDKNMKTLPTIASGISITRVEIWVTNKTASTTNNRNIVAFADLGEHDVIGRDDLWGSASVTVASNKANTEYNTLVNSLADARDISQASTVLDNYGLVGGEDYEKLQSARLLSSSEYYLNSSLGYVSLNSTLQTDEILAIAYEYTYAGVTYQVGEFSADLTDNSSALFVKLLKGSSGSPSLPTWRLMMKNVYSLGASSTTKDKFKLDIKYQSDSSGVYLTYLPEEKLKSTTLLKAMNLDRLDDNNKANSNGKFDYVDGYTIYKGRIYFPVAEPFGEHLREWIGDDVTADKYCFPELYDSTKTVAKQMAEHDKFLLTGQYTGSNAGQIDLGATNIAQGSVVVTAGGVTLTENTDYIVDYNMGTVTIINQSIVDAGTTINASVESNDNYGMQRKTMLGVNLDYKLNDNFTIGGSVFFLNEQPLTTKVSMGNEPLRNTLWGLHTSWKRESQWLTNMLDKIPLINATQPSQISFDGEFAQLVAGQNKRIQGEASYLDDFENSSNKQSLTTPTYWTMSSTPSMFTESKLNNDIQYGYNRALLAWYYVDPIFTRRSSTLTPAHIKSDLDQLSNHYVREVYERELYPQKAQNSYTSATSLSVLNLAYYPSERGAYNLCTDVDRNGKFLYPQEKWGGMMRKMDNTDFETMNVEYIEFWLLDPFIYTSGQPGNYGGDFYINLGEVSEDILKDGKKFYESGMPIDGDPTYYTETVWGRVPSSTTSVTYAFNNDGGARSVQDIGFNGLSSEEELTFGAYAQYVQEMQGIVNEQVYDSIVADPAGDDYHYYRGTDFDQAQTSILDRYKRINMPEGNSPDSNNSPESYETAYKTTPDVEDLNQDYTLNEYEKYYQYHVSIRPEDMVVGRNHITDMRTSSVKLRNGNTEEVNWYLFRLPLDEWDSRVGSISDFTSIRFMRMFLTNFEEPVILRFATLDLVYGDWRPYEQSLYQGDASSSSATLTVSTVNIEENNDKTPVNYVLPPGISRVTDPSQSQLVEENEQALCMVVENLQSGEAKAVYKNCKYDMRQYKHLQLFVHANALINDATNLKDGETSVFLRLGSDYKSNFYEYEVPLTLTPEGNYDTYSSAGCYAVWPEDNMIDINLDILTDLKKDRNKQKSLGMASFSQLYYDYDPDKQNNKISIMGNPSLGEVKTIMIGIRNNGRTVKSVEVWVNELRLQEFTNDGGWAAQGNLNIQFSDIGSVNAQGKIETAGFGGLEQTVEDRSNEDTYNYSITTSIDLGRLLPDKARVNFPMYYSYNKEVVKPKYNPLDTDMLLSDALDALQTKAEKDSLKALTTTTEVQKNLSFSGVKANISSLKHPMPYDPANFTFNYAHQSTRKEGVTTVYEVDKSWKGGLNYAWTPNWQIWEPLKNLKSKSKWLQIVKDQNLAFAPQSITFSTDINRTYYELQERDVDDMDNPQSLPVSFSQSFLWNRSFSIRWDIFKALHFSFESGTNAEIEEPYTPVNKDLYADHYSAWKDSIKYSLRHFGRPLDYSQSTSLSYKLPIDKIPLFDWLSADASYTGTYSWVRGTEQEDGSTLGNTINTQRTINMNGKVNLETLYNHSDFLKEANKRFSASNAKSESKKKVDEKKKADEAKKKAEEDKKKARQAAEEEAKKTGEPVDSILARQAQQDAAKQTNAQGTSQQKDNRKQKGFVEEVTLRTDTTTTITHNQKSKRLLVSARDSLGHAYKLKYKKLDENKILVKNKDSIQLRINVIAKPPLDELKWYSAAQAVSRFAMMVRNVSVSYRNTYNLYLPGFLPDVGDMLGQRRSGGMFQPGLDFAFGLVGDSYIDKAKERGWLLVADSVSTPSTTNTTEDLQIKASLEPFSDFKIDLSFSRTMNRSKSIQYMYSGNPTTQTGSFSMTILSLKSSFGGKGNARNGYQSKNFERFRSYLPILQQRVEAQYTGLQYPSGTGFSGTFNPENGTVDTYSADVMIPAFLAAYAGGNPKRTALDIFPSLARMLPNWSVTYKGLSTLPWIRDHFKSVNLTHGYKSIYSIGSYSSYSSWIEAFTGSELGFVENTTTESYVPSTMYNISTVSINESWTPLAGINVTFMNNMTAKMEYKVTRAVTLSMTSAQINETSSRDIVLGWGYKINDFRLSSLIGGKKASAQAAKSNRTKGGRNDDDSKNSSQNSRNTKNQIAHDLNLSFDFSLRNQDAINRDIQTGTSEATSGNKAIKTSFQMSYTMSRYVTLSLYYDRQKNSPLLSSSSYPTITQDFGLSMKFSLTR